MTESEWRNLGVQQSPGWIHYLIHAPGKEQSQLCIVVTCWWYTGTSPLGHLCSRDTSSKFGPKKNVHIIFVFVTSVLGTPLLRGKGHCFWVPKPRFNLHSGDILAIKRWLITKIVDKIKCWLVTMATAFKTWTTGISLKIYILHLWEFNTQLCRDKLIIFSAYKESGVR